MSAQAALAEIHIPDPIEAEAFLAWLLQIGAPVLDAADRLTVRADMPQEALEKLLTQYRREHPTHG